MKADSLMEEAEARNKKTFAEKSCHSGQEGSYNINEMYKLCLALPVEGATCISVIL